MRCSCLLAALEGESTRSCALILCVLGFLSWASTEVDITMYVSLWWPAFSRPVSAQTLPNSHGMDVHLKVLASSWSTALFNLGGCNVLYELAHTFVQCWGNLMSSKYWWTFVDVWVSNSVLSLLTSLVHHWVYKRGCLWVMVVVRSWSLFLL